MKQQVKRFLRVLLGRDYYPKIDTQCECVRLGSATAGWTVALQFLQNDSVVYCVGIGEDISFDLALYESIGVAIDAFDPTPKALSWIGKQTLPPTYRVHEYGLADFDGKVPFAPPANPDFVSYTISHSTGDIPPPNAVIAEVRRFSTICRELGHSNVDLLKLDIEGAEYDVIEDFKNIEVLPNQLLIEFHHRLAGIGIARTRNAVAILKRLGYRLFYVSPNGEEYSFIANSTLLRTR